MKIEAEGQSADELLGCVAVKVWVDVVLGGSEVISNIERSYDCNETRAN